MAIYFCADCHFGQERTLKMSLRPFDSVSEMDKVLINNWNSLIKPEDTVYILGDFGILSYAKFLSGKKHFIRGNYEYNYTDEELLKYFDLVCPSKTVHIPIIHNDTLYHFTMAHEPKNVKEFKISDNYVNVFGHVHKLQMIKSYGINVGMDCHNFKPISIDDVLFYHNAILTFYDENVLS